MSIASKLAEVRKRIARAAQQSGRNPGEVALMAVSKTHAAAAILEAIAAGQMLFGENRVQEFAAKRDGILAGALAPSSGARFHLIGHLQSNKARKGAELFDVIQTVDSAKLARRLAEAGKPMEVMIEVKLSEEESKHGCAPADVPALVEAIRAQPQLTLKGLMTMPPWSDDAEVARPYFQRLRELARQTGVEGLSMGMSNDLEVAIEEGSTLVRVGTALFGRRKKPA
jgi:pyridoxal phosphate enzyme (YggS family)